MCSLSHFPSPPQRGFRTLCEIDGRLVVTSNKSSSEPSQFTDELSDYPKVTITKASLNPTISKESVKSAFLVTEESQWTKIVSTLNQHGIISALKELARNREILRSPWLRNVAGFVLSTIRRIRDVYGSIYPPWRLSDDEIVEEFTSVSEWHDGLIRCFSWHPHTTKFAVAQRDDTIKIFSPQRITLILKHRQQQMIGNLSWLPLSSSTLAVACHVGVVVWTIDPTSVVTRPSSSCVQILTRNGHSPVTSVQFSPCGRLLISASPLDNSMIVWDVATQIGVALKQVTGGGVSFIRWSLDGQHLFAATPSNVFRVWETRTWTSDFWRSGSGRRCRASCWSPDGTVLLTAMDNEAVVYSISFAETSSVEFNSVGGSKTAVPIIDLSKVDFDSETVGGHVQSMVWDKSGQRLAVSFSCKESRQELVAVFRTTTKPILDINPCGFVRGLPGDVPQCIAFQDSFGSGALLTVCWSSGEISHIPFFLPQISANRLEHSPIDNRTNVRAPHSLSLT